MKTTIVIYEMVPDETIVYVLDDLSEDEEAKVLMCHGQYINQLNSQDVDEAMQWLSEKLGTGTAFDRTPLTRQIAFDRPVQIVVTGFIL